MFRLSAGTDPTESIIDKVLKNAEKFGILPNILMKELSERESIISQLLVNIPDESKIVGYFTDFLFTYKIPWSKTRDLMMKALAAPSNGGEVEPVLDFALAHYVRKKNIAQTKQIIDDGLKLQSNTRSLNIFNSLLGALQNKPIDIQPLQFGPDNIKDIFVFNKLVAQTLAKPEEDYEMLRRKFVESLDELERTREVDDRYKATFQALQSIEFNEQLSRLTEFVTRLFEVQLNDPAMLAFRRLLIQLKMGIEFRRQFFSDVENVQTAPGIRDTSGDPGESARLRELSELLRGASVNKYIKVAQTNPIANAKVQVVQFLDGIIKNLEIAKTGFNTWKSNPNDPIFKNLPPQLGPVFAETSKIITETQSKIQDLKSNVEKGAIEIEKSFDSFNQIWNGLGGNIISAINGLPNATIEISDIVGNEDKISAFARAIGFDPRIFNNIIGALMGVDAVRSVLSLDIKNSLLSIMGLILANDNIKKETLAKIVGKAVPKSDDTLINVNDLRDALLRLNIGQQQANDIINLTNYANSVRATIADREQTLAKRMVTEIKTNSDTQVSAPLAGNKEIQQEYSRFYAYLQEVNKNLSYFMDLTDAIVKQARTLKENEFAILNKTGPLLESRAKIEAIIVEVRSKLAKYKSYVKIVGNVQKRNRLIQDLQVLIPEIEKFMASGISIADLFFQPGGIKNKMKEMSDSLIEDRDNLYAEIQKIKQAPKLPMRFKRVPVTPTQPYKPEFVGENKQEAMEPPTFSTFEDRPK